MESILSLYPDYIIQQASQIKLIAFDVDGVLTDGGIIYDNRHMEYKKFHVRDGQIMGILKLLGFRLCAITGRESEVVKYRMEELKVDYHYHGVQDKLGVLDVVRKKNKLHFHEIAYIGDDLPDIKPISISGLGVTPADAPLYVKAQADLVTAAKGGEGVLREVADLILAAQNLLEKLLYEKYYLNENIQ
jgi:3-deoxy-D-manno-octulosonate 8-phosphate phosphatase (KDO 8-P phosphatase)